MTDKAHEAREREIVELSNVLRGYSGDEKVMLLWGNLRRIMVERDEACSAGREFLQAYRAASISDEEGMARPEDWRAAWDACDLEAERLERVLGDPDTYEEFRHRTDPPPFGRGLPE